MESNLSAIQLKCNKCLLLRGWGSMVGGVKGLLGEGGWWWSTRGVGCLLRGLRVY